MSLDAGSALAPAGYRPPRRVPVLGLAVIALLLTAGAHCAHSPKIRAVDYAALSWDVLDESFTAYARRQDAALALLRDRCARTPPDAGACEQARIEGGALVDRIAAWDLLSLAVATALTAWDRGEDVDLVALGRDISAARERLRALGILAP